MLDYYDLTEAQQRATERLNQCCIQVAAIQRRLVLARLASNSEEVKKWRFHLKAAERGQGRAADELRR